MEIRLKRFYYINTPLLVWFFLDMTGFYILGKTLVSQAYSEDGIFMIIYLSALLVFIFYNKIGKVILLIWLSLWLIAQLYSHWYFTIFGPWEGKNNYFTDTIKLIPSSERYMPDLYHIMLHILIVVALINTIVYCAKSQESLCKNKV